MNDKKVIICDLDGTLAPSKSAVSSEMAETISKILVSHKLAIISGGGYSQFQKQFLSELTPSENFKNLYLFPTMGSTCYIWDVESKKWKQSYDESMTPEQRDEIVLACEKLIKDESLDVLASYGERVEDRGSQVTFSALGQEAPLDLKEKWDPTQEKRRRFVEILKTYIPKYEIRIGGMTSIDITKSGLDKAYAIGKIKELLKIEEREMVFIGDALYEGGNDAPIKKTGVDYIQQSGPEETLEYLMQLV
ncbi:HAD-IIB family hydrolase [Patescibacteria group bacterium]|nr:HAD-IIB family hydrolase [Patescibacteria group bacterium]